MWKTLSIFFVFIATSSYSVDSGSEIIQEGTCSPEIIENPVVFDSPKPVCVLKSSCIAKGNDYLVSTACPLLSSGKCTQNLKQCDKEGHGLTRLFPVAAISIAESDPNVTKKGVPANPFETYHLLVVTLDPNDPKAQKDRKCIGRVDGKSVPSATYAYPYVLCKTVTIKSGEKNIMKCPSHEDCFAKRLEIPANWTPYVSKSSAHAVSTEGDTHQKSSDPSSASRPISEPEKR